MKIYKVSYKGNDWNKTGDVAYYEIGHFKNRLDANKAICDFRKQSKIEKEDKCFIEEIEVK